MRGLSHSLMRESSRTFLRVPATSSADVGGAGWRPRSSTMPLLLPLRNPLPGPLRGDRRDLVHCSSIVSLPSIVYSPRARRIASHSNSLSTVCPDNPVLGPSGVSVTRSRVVERITEQPEPSSCCPTKMTCSIFATLFPHRTNFGWNDRAADPAPQAITSAATMDPLAWIIASAFEVAILPSLS